MEARLENESKEEVESFFWPTSWTVDEIQPKLHLYRAAKEELVLDHTVSVEDALAQICDNGYLTTTTSKITFVVHGFRNTIDTPWLAEMKDALLVQSDQLVVIVSWGKGSDLLPIYYLQAAANIQAVAAWLAPFIGEIQKMKPEIGQYGVGHSLGSHLIGVAGRESEALQRITALDPAGPAFEHDGEFLKFRLKNTDAKLMVDVIHTDGYHSKLDPADWLSPVNHYGTLLPLGTLDFYPNYGYAQPGAGTFEIAGSHTRAIEYFIWSISNPKKFKTNFALAERPSFEQPVKDIVEVDLEAEMGYFANEAYSKTGLFYVETKKSPPWVETPQESSYCTIS